ncbi:MAG: alpha-2,8-polysialyltransferase family protein [Bacteroides sp.]|nr:alpha-2,8-polysialyltransferase family protein [Bacteroides sp.]
MKNLFVLHTQYNLILAIALIEECYAEEENSLILFEDFVITESMKMNLRKYFHSVDYCVGSYNKKDLKWRKKLLRYPSLKHHFSKDKTIYDNLFIVEDTVFPEQILMKQTRNKNKNSSISYIGDGGDAYFTNTTGPSFGEKSSLICFGKKLLKKYLLGAGDYYCTGYCFGMSDNIQIVYELYPSLLRNELKNKNHHEIKAPYLIRAIRILFEGVPVPGLNEKALIVLLDKLAVYGDFVEFNKTVAEIETVAEREGLTIYYKYHPAEKDTFSGADKWVEIDRKLSAECILAFGNPETMKVVGIMTTALQTAAKMGYDTTSYIKSYNPKREDVIELYNEIGIKTL